MEALNINVMNTSFLVDNWPFSTSLNITILPPCTFWPGFHISNWKQSKQQSLWISNQNSAFSPIHLSRILAFPNLQLSDKEEPLQIEITMKFLVLPQIALLGLHATHITAKNASGSGVNCISAKYLALCNNFQSWVSEQYRRFSGSGGSGRGWGWGWLIQLKLSSPQSSSSSLSPSSSTSPAPQPSPMWPVLESSPIPLQPTRSS